MKFISYDNITTLEILLIFYPKTNFLSILNFMRQITGTWQNKHERV